MGVWIFGYGSLLWKIDFPTIRKIIGYVEGFHRTMEWADEVHRGVPGQQSRTAAIFRSDNLKQRVWGVAYEIGQDFWNRELEVKLGFRERGGYLVVPTEFIPFDPNVNNVPDKIMVTIFLGDKTSPYYKPGTIEELAHHIYEAVGASGTNLEYLYSTAESLMMILPPGEEDKHMMDLMVAAKKLEALGKTLDTLRPSEAVLEEKYEKRRELLLKIYRATDLDMDRKMNLSEFYDLAVNKLNLKESLDTMKKKFEEIDVNKDGKLSTKEFIDYFLTELQERENAFKEEYRRFGIKMPEGGVNDFENALLLYEIMQDAGLNSSYRQKSLGEMLIENKTLLERMRIRTIPDAREVLEFYFPQSIEEAVDVWFGKSKELDARVKDKFTTLVERALKGELDDWMNTPNNCLALVILLNQLTRSIYRNTPKMFQGDCKAQGVALKAIFYGYWKSLTPLQTVFLPCMVLSTTENIHFQELTVQIWINYIQASLPAQDPLRFMQDFFKRNLDTITRFGRFPHRNKILGRVSTKEEVDFLNDPNNHFDVALKLTANGTFERKAVEMTDSPWPELDFSTKIEDLERE